MVAEKLKQSDPVKAFESTRADSTPKHVGWKNATILVALLAILAVSFTLRAYGGITWGLPDRYHPDEPFIMDRAVAVFSRGDANPHFFDYPSLYIYLQAAVEPLGKPLQRFVDSEYSEQASGLALIQARQLAVGRLVTVIIGTLTVFLVFSVGARFYGRAAGLIGAALIGVHLPHISNSQFVTTDVPSAALVLCVAFCSLENLRTRSLRWLVAAGIMAGLAAGTKYPAGVSLVMPLSAAAMSYRGRILLRNGLAVVLASCLLFLATTPYAVLDFHDFWPNLKFLLNDAGSGHAGAEGSDTWRWYIDRFLFSAPYTGLFMGAGIVYAVVRRGKQELVLLSFILTYYVLIASPPVRFERYLTPMAPIAAVLGGRVLADLAATSSRWKLSPLAPAVLGVAILFFLTWTTVRAWEQDRSLLRPDTRQLARDWINENLPPGSHIAREFYTPSVGPQFFVTESFGLYEQKLDVTLCQAHYILASDANYGRYFAPDNRYPERRAFYESVLKLPVAKQFKTQRMAVGPTIVILRVPPDACQDQLADHVSYSATEPYRAVWGEDKTPTTIARDATVEVTISFANAGSLDWDPSSANPVRFGYHWSRGRCPGTNTEVVDGRRTRLPWPVHPGEAVRAFNAVVKAPSSPGTFCLQYDLVREGVAWFSTQGPTGPSRTVTIE